MKRAGSEFFRDATHPCRRVFYSYMLAPSGINHSIILGHCSSYIFNLLRKTLIFNLVVFLNTVTQNQHELVTHPEQYMTTFIFLIEATSVFTSAVLPFTSRYLGYYFGTKEEKEQDSNNHLFNRYTRNTNVYEYQLFAL